jgi:hypothetical protein
MLRSASNSAWVDEDGSLTSRISIDGSINRNQQRAALSVTVQSLRLPRRSGGVFYLAHNNEWPQLALSLRRL